jgi:hypothetical protein
MTLSRRLLLQTPVAVTAGGAAAGAARVSPAAAGPGECLPTLVAFVDTLLPAHAGSPAASALEVPHRLLQEAARQRRRLRLLYAGCRWLDGVADAAAGTAFAGLDEARREAIVAAAQGASPRSVQAQFFGYVHRQAMTLFYTRRESWPALDYPGPPQPAGFLDFQGAPRTGRG